ncbi:MAG: 23S rRNA (pseudouridine(1915)-N(3))-methyltransferase RlmH [Chlamydiia bacterium]|nr:23S rRNA (pseudouridine(1915)-N(3))-methyltransferase RlmH [Chlamydiia bacterium]
MKLKLFSVGKTKEAWLQAAIEEYQKRLQGDFEIKLFKDRYKLKEACDKEKRLVLLDPSGKVFTSEQFSEFLMKELELGGASLTFVIGDADGLPEGLEGAKVSLSKMTFTHQIARLVLVEQVFRAFEIEKGSKYHK